MAEHSLLGKWSKSGPYLQSVLHIVAAIVFLLAGTMKIFAFPKGILPDGGTAEFLSQVWIGGVLEVVGGVVALLHCCVWFSAAGAGPWSVDARLSSVR